MQYIMQFARILIICFFGEILSNILPLPIPASIYGIILLFVALKSGIYKLEQIKETGNFFLNILTIFFVPAAVGIIDQVDLLFGMLFPCIVATIPITILVMGVSGRLSQIIHHYQEKNNKRSNDDVFNS